MELRAAFAIRSAVNFRCPVMGKFFNNREEDKKLKRDRDLGYDLCLCVCCVFLSYIQMLG